MTAPDDDPPVLAGLEEVLDELPVGPSPGREELRAILASRLVTSRLGFVGVALGDEDAFAAQLGLSREALAEWLDRVAALLSEEERRGIRAAVPLRVSLMPGVPRTTDGEQAVAALSLSPPLDLSLPPSVDLRPSAPAVREQGPNRSTCTAFATVAVLELGAAAAGGSLDLSEQYLYHLTKERDSSPFTTTFLRHAFGVVADVGVCREHLWPYASSFVPSLPVPDFHPLPAGTSRATLDSDARHHRLASVRPIAPGPTAVDAVRRELSAGGAVAVTLEVDPTFHGDLSLAAGSPIKLPAPRPIYPLHSVALVGYEDSHPERPAGEGVFLVRNSYRQWAKSGYGLLPYAYLRRHATEIFTGTLA